MYGIVNKSIEELVISQFGEDKWLEVKKRSGIDVDFFISNEPYNDDITYKLAIAISETLGTTVDSVLFRFGEWWILETTRKKYGVLMKSAGSSLKEFLVNLPNFHNHIMLMYPQLTPPEFKVSHVEETSLHIHYFSKRKGLQEFVRGLLSGLGKMFDTKLDIQLIEGRAMGDGHEVFKLNWT